MDNAYDNTTNENTGEITIDKNYKPNAEEQKLLDQCRVEGNFRGAIGAVLTGGIMYQSIKSFNLTINPKFGIWVKVGPACLFGFFVGKLMGIPSCHDKLKHLPNSPLGAFLRQRQAIHGKSLPTDSATDASSNFALVNTPTYRGDGRMNSAIDIDVYSSPSNMDSYTGDELNGPNSGAPIDNLSDQTYANKPAVSYAELRRRNRDEYSRAEKEKYSLGRSKSDDIPAPAAQPIRRSTSVNPTEKKNMYGDVLE